VQALSKTLSRHQSYVVWNIDEAKRWNHDGIASAGQSGDLGALALPPFQRGLCTSSRANTFRQKPWL